MAFMENEIMFALLPYIVAGVIGIYGLYEIRQTTKDLTKPGGMVLIFAAVLIVYLATKRK